MNIQTDNPLRAEPVFRSSRVIPESASADTLEQRIERLEALVNSLTATVLNLSAAAEQGDTLFKLLGEFMAETIVRDIEADNRLDEIERDVATTGTTIDSIFALLNGPEPEEIDGEYEEVEDEPEFVDIEIPAIPAMADFDAYNEAIATVREEIESARMLGLIGYDEAIILRSAVTGDAEEEAVATLPMDVDLDMTFGLLRAIYRDGGGGLVYLPEDEQFPANFSDLMIKFGLICKLSVLGIQIKDDTDEDEG